MQLGSLILRFCAHTCCHITFETCRSPIVVHENPPYPSGIRIYLVKFELVIPSSFQQSVQKGENRKVPPGLIPVHPCALQVTSLNSFPKSIQPCFAKPKKYKYKFLSSILLNKNHGKLCTLSWTLLACPNNMSSSPAVLGACHLSITVAQSLSQGGARIW